MCSSISDTKHFPFSVRTTVLNRRLACQPSPQPCSVWQHCALVRWLCGAVRAAKWATRTASRHGFLICACRCAVRAPLALSLRECEREMRCRGVALLRRRRRRRLLPWEWRPCSCVVVVAREVRRGQRAGLLLAVTTSARVAHLRLVLPLPFYGEFVRAHRARALEESAACGIGLFLTVHDLSSAHFSLC